MRESGREDFVDDGIMESPNIKSEDDCDLARFEDFDDEEMGDVGCENVQLKGVRGDKGGQSRGLAADPDQHPEEPRGHAPD